MDTITLAMAKAFTRRKIEEAGISGGGSGGEVNLTPEQVEEILEAVKLKHTHENQSILDQITAEVLREEVPHTYVLPETAKDGDLCLCAPTNTLTIKDRKIYFDWEEFRKPYISNNEEYSEASCHYYGENKINDSTYSITLDRGPEICFFSIESGGPDWHYECYINFQNGEIITEDSWDGFTNAENEEGIVRQFSTIEELPQYIELPQVDWIQTDNYNYDNVFLFYAEYELMKYQGGEWVKVEQNQITEEWLNNLSENTRLRHAHTNLDLLETIIPEMLENRVPTVYFLPEKGESGDLCLYGIPNIITKEDSGKYIYFDWKEIEKTDPDKGDYSDITVFKGYSTGTAGEVRVEVNCEIWHGTLFFELEITYEDGIIEEYFISYILYNKEFRETPYYQKYTAGGENIEYIEYTKDTLPTCIKLPEFNDFIIEEKNSEIDIPFFFTNKYKLMAHQGGEWIDACASESGALPVAYINDEGELCFELGSGINDAYINDKGELELVIETENGDKTANLGKIKGRTPELRLTEKILEIKYDDETEWNTLVDFSTITSGATEEQIKNAVDEYLAENPVSGITVTDDGNGNVTIA